VYYQPPRALGLIVGGLLTLWSAALTFLLLDAGITGGTSILAFLAFGCGVAALALCALFAYWTYSLATLTYTLDRNGLVITWGAVRQVVPLQAIDRLVPGTSAGVPSVQGVSWWGHHVGSAEVDRIGYVLFYSTHQAPDQVLYVLTVERNYAITVEDASTFAREVQRRQDLGPTAVVEHRVERSGAALQSVMADPWARWLCTAAVVGAAVVWAYIAVRYSSLPPTLTLHFPPTAQDTVLTVTAREAILELPRVATLLLLANLAVGSLLHTWDRMAAYLLFAAAVAAQVIMLVAVVLAIGW
jgi:hypothetical protein